MKEKIISLLLKDLSYGEIVKIVGCSKATISYHAKKLGLQKPIPINEIDWNEVQLKYDSGFTYKECKKVYGFSSMSWSKAVKSGSLKIRNNPISLVDLKVRSNVKKRILKENLIPYICKECGLSNEWNTKKLVLQLDHINGINNDNRIENLRFLCPNCHSQTSTYCGRNKNIRE